MSAILSADDLNDFISPGVACIKPIETLPAQNSGDSSNPYEVTTEDKVAASQPPPPAQISLTDCLACSGCVTSAEAMLVTLQSHNEVLTTLDSYPSLHPPWLAHNGTNGNVNGMQHRVNGVSNRMDGHHAMGEGKLFIASVSPQARASLAAVFGVSEAQAGNMIAHLLSGPSGLKAGGTNGSYFTWVIDTNTVREACLVAAADEVYAALSSDTETRSSTPNSEGAIDTIPKKPILTSACPGWICYAEKTHPYILPHLSRLKSPQALTGTLIKSVLSRRFSISPSQIWHLAIMPCFDKKLEASRSELTSSAWLPSNHDSSQDPIRDVDCVITARELLHLASARSISFSSLPRTPLSSSHRILFPDPNLDAFLFPPTRRKNEDSAVGSSGGFLSHILQTYQTQYPGSTISVSRGRNADVVEYSLLQNSQVILKMARYYGFRNIQNLVRRLKPAKLSRLPGARSGGTSRRPGAAGGGGEGVKDYAYIEVMACPGGCTNGGGQIKVTEVQEVRAAEGLDGSDMNGFVPAVGGKPGPKEQKEWLGRVDEAYFSASDDDNDNNSNHGSSRKDQDGDQEMRDVDVPRTTYGDDEQNAGQDDIINGISRSYIHNVLAHWSNITGIEQQKLVYTSYRKVESDVGKKQSDVERVAGLASSLGGGW